MNETLKRALSGAVYIVLLLFCIIYSKESFFILFGLFMLVACYEFSKLVHINTYLSLVLGLVFYSSIIGLVFYPKFIEHLLSTKIVLNINLVYNILLAFTLVISIRCIFFLFCDSEKQISVFSKYLFLLGYIILPFLFITKISFGEKNYNNKIIIGLFILIWTNDTFAYLVGKNFGKHKLLEKISPKKTIEGFAGGVLFAMLAAALLSKFYIKPNPSFQNTSYLIWIFIALIAGVVGTIGDLIESKFKRLAGVKDSGSIMPGHGGILDRLDSIIFVAPFIYLFYQILYYISNYA
ncbi:phosphatidate cytidylyltransferase [Flavobacterium croceum DSM 17960]|uniref:Phosphatidate cytidylyltransferase n=1 Tax=Flavobacterium croceum DSM 17960 TaxID=1121886 RepID=A0A2S4N796_9FLAO|nr:phosphatidate cytidylyltransferase [Flavobacterium croceum]POS01592.1 phosphatidate cytidylyltransferase [Flavobacterium croceum DSM 17960]